LWTTAPDSPAAQSGITRQEVWTACSSRKIPNTSVAPEKRKRVFGGIFLLAAMIPNRPVSRSHESESASYRAVQFAGGFVEPDPAGEAPRAAVSVPNKPETAPPTPAEPAETNIAIPNPQSVADSPPSATKAAAPFFQCEYNAFRGSVQADPRGMTYEEVVKVVGDDNVLVSGGLSATKLVKWESPDGSFFTAKFQNNVLERTDAVSCAPQEGTCPIDSPSRPARGLCYGGHHGGFRSPAVDDSMEAETPEEEEISSRRCMRRCMKKNPREL